MTMRALIYDGDLRLDEAASQPVPTGDEVLLKIRRAGICNTDLELVEGMYGFSGILGHEFVAEVADGPADWIGRRVVGEINVVCGGCDFCQADVPSQCRHRRAVGIHDYPGAFAEYMPLPLRNLYPVPDSVSDDAAVFTEPLAAALQVLEAVQISPRDRVVVLGVGKLGMLVAQVLKLTGADVTGVVRRQKQADLLRQWGITASAIDDLESEQAQVVVDCTGQAQGFADALRLVRSRGTIVLKSTYHGTPQADLTQVAVREIRVVGSRCGPFPAALRLLERRLVDVESLVDARYPFWDALNAFGHAQKPGALKVLLYF
jgi:threonine dehydrogenase-like Zn-dependent dehydrogenase